MTEDRPDQNNAGAVIEAAEVPGPTFIKVLQYDALKKIGSSPAFLNLRIEAKKRYIRDDGQPSPFTAA
jgi:hypothetical protein